MNSFVSFECELWMFCFVILPQLNTRFSMYSQCYAIITTKYKKSFMTLLKSVPFQILKSKLGFEVKTLDSWIHGLFIFPRFLPNNPSTCSLFFPVVCFTTAQVTMTIEKNIPTNYNSPRWLLFILSFQKLGL